jgi:hypothetical protein
MSGAPESIVVTCGPEAMVVSSQQIVRYAGGRRYCADASQRKRVGAALERAARLVHPAYAYCLYGVTDFLSGGDITLDNRTTLPMPPCAQDPGVQYFAVCVCTLGRKLEEMVRALMSAGKGMEGLLLDAAGVAFLEALGARALDSLRVHAQEGRLHFGRRFGPGYGGVDLSVQKRVFALVDAAAIGVRLNEYCVMTPEKSLSFFAEFTTTPLPPVGPNKCESCHLTSCLYRC